MRRLALLVGGTAAVALMGSTLSPVTADARPVSPRLVHTPFSFTAGAFGTQVRGGSLPAGSDQTAYANISCQSGAGINKTNHIAAVAQVPRERLVHRGHQPGPDQSLGQVRPARR